MRKAESYNHDSVYVARINQSASTFSSNHHRGGRPTPSSRTRRQHKSRLMFTDEKGITTPPGDGHVRPSQSATPIKTCVQMPNNAPTSELATPHTSRTERRKVTATHAGMEDLKKPATLMVSQIKQNIKTDIHDDATTRIPYFDRLAAKCAFYLGAQH